MCLCLCASVDKYLRRIQEGIISPATGVTGRYELPSTCAGAESGPPQEEQAP